MNLAPIPQIKAELRRMYQNFRFDMKPAPSGEAYQVIAYRGVDRAGDITIQANTPLNVFWDEIKAWMLTVMRSQ